MEHFGPQTHWGSCSFFNKLNPQNTFFFTNTDFIRFLPTPTAYYGGHMDNIADLTNQFM